MKNIFAAIGLIIFIIYLCSRKLPPEVDFISNPELLAHKKAALTTTDEKVEGAEIENTEIKKTSPLTKNDNTKNWTTHPKPVHKHHLAMEAKHRHHCIERLKAEHRLELDESLPDNERALALARAAERSITSNQQPKLPHNARISRLPDMGIKSIRRSHGYAEVAFRRISSPRFAGKDAQSNYGKLAHSATASSDAHEDEIEEESNGAAAMNGPSKEGAPADEPTPLTMVHPAQVIAEGPTTEFSPEEFSEILDERQLEEMPTLGEHCQGNMDAAVVSDVYGSEVNSAWFELQAQYQVPDAGTATSLWDLRNYDPGEEPMQEAISEPANAGIYLTPAQAEEYNRASAEANSTRNPFDSDDEAEDEDEDEACDNISQSGAEEVRNGVKQDSIGPAFFSQSARNLVVDPSPPAMTAASAAPTNPEQKAIHLSPEQLEEYNQVSSAAFNARNPFDSDDEEDEPSTVGLAAQKTSTESQSTSAQTPPVAEHASQTAPTPVPAPASAPATVNLKMVFPETDALPRRAAAPSTAPTHTWHNPAPALTVAVATSLPPHHSSYIDNAPPPDATYSPDYSPYMAWEHSNPTPMDWDTSTSIHLSNPPGQIITVGGFDIEAGTLREFREVRGATRLNKKGRQQQMLLDCRAGPGKKSLAKAVARGDGERTTGVSKSGRGKRGGERRRGEKAEDCLMTFF